MRNGRIRVPHLIKGPSFASGQGRLESRDKLLSVHERDIIALQKENGPFSFRPVPSQLCCLAHDLRMQALGQRPVLRRSAHEPSPRHLVRRLDDLEWKGEVRKLNLATTLREAVRLDLNELLERIAHCPPILILGDTRIGEDDVEAEPESPANAVL